MEKRRNLERGEIGTSQDKKKKKRGHSLAHFELLGHGKKGGAVCNWLVNGEST